MCRRLEGHHRIARAPRFWHCSPRSQIHSLCPWLRLSGCCWSQQFHHKPPVYVKSIEHFVSAVFSFGLAASEVIAFAQPPLLCSLASYHLPPISSWSKGLINVSLGQLWSCNSKMQHARAMPQCLKFNRFYRVVRVISCFNSRGIAGIPLAVCLTLNTLPDPLNKPFGIETISLAPTLRWVDKCDLESGEFTLKTTGNNPPQGLWISELRQHWLDVRKIPAMTKKNSWHILGPGRAIVTCDRDMW